MIWGAAELLRPRGCLRFLGDQNLGLRRQPVAECGTCDHQQKLDEPQDRYQQGQHIADQQADEEGEDDADQGADDDPEDGLAPRSSGLQDLRDVLLEGAFRAGEDKRAIDDELVSACDPRLLVGSGGIESGVIRRLDIAVGVQGIGERVIASEPALLVGSGGIEGCDECGVGHDGLVSMLVSVGEDPQKSIMMDGNIPSAV